jgi:hypothetical protein
MTIIDGIESAVYFFSVLVISGAVLCGIAYCFILIKELWQKIRGRAE